MGSVSYEGLAPFFTGRLDRFSEYLSEVYREVKQFIHDDLRYFYFKGMLGEDDISQVEFLAFTDTKAVSFRPREDQNGVSTEITVRCITDIRALKFNRKGSVRYSNGLDINFSDGSILILDASEDSNDPWYSSFCDAIKDIYGYLFDVMS